MLYYESASYFQYTSMHRCSLRIILCRIPFKVKEFVWKESLGVRKTVIDREKGKGKKTNNTWICKCRKNKYSGGNLFTQAEYGKKVERKASRKQ